MGLLIKKISAYLGEGLERSDSVDILIEKGRISKIGSNLKRGKYTVLHGKDLFVTPGLVNAHFHPSQQMNRGLGVGYDHQTQMDLLHACSKLKQDQEKYLCAMLAVLEGLRCGTTSFYSVGSDLEMQVKLFNQLGVRAACTMIPKDIDAPEKSEEVRAETWNTQERLETAERLHKKYHNDLVRVHFGVCNVRYASDNLIKGMHALARKYAVYFHMHIAENDTYRNEVIKRTGRSPVKQLHHLGCLDEIVSMAHAVKIDNEDIALIAEAKAHVVHCPRANAYVAVGVCPVKELYSQGVNIALGSDAAINNNSNEVRGEARALADKLSDRFGRADIVPYLDLFRMLTINGAKAMGLDSEIGSIDEGKRADLAIWSKNDLPFIPGHNYIADLIFADSCRAHTVIINGKRVISNYRAITFNERNVILRARKLSQRYQREVNNYVRQYIGNKISPLRPPKTTKEI